MQNSEIDIYRSKAKECLEKKDIYGFAENISPAKYIAAKENHLVTETLVDEIEGLYLLRQYGKLVTLIDESIHRINDNDILLDLLHKKGEALGKLGRFPEAVEVFKGLTETDHAKYRIWAYNSLTWIQLEMYKRNPEPATLLEAEAFCLKALELAKDTDRNSYRLGMTNFGNIMWRKGDFEQALKGFLQVDQLSIYKSAFNLNNIAATYVSLANRDEALRVLSEAEKIALIKRDELEIAQCYSIRGRLSEEVEEDFLQAKDYYIVAYNSFIEAGYLTEANRIQSKIFDLDHTMNNENNRLLAKNLEKNHHCESYKNVFSGNEIV